MIDTAVCDIVAVPPTVFSLRNVTQAEGAEVTLVCKSHGDPAPRMSFKKTGNAEEYHMGENVSI